MEENEIQFNNRLNLSDLQASVFQIKAELSKVIVELDFSVLTLISGDFFNCNRHKR